MGALQDRAADGTAGHQVIASGGFAAGLDAVFLRGSSGRMAGAGDRLRFGFAAAPAGIGFAAAAAFGRGFEYTLVPVVAQSRKLRMRPAERFAAAQAVDHAVITARFRTAGFDAVFFFWRPGLVAGRGDRLGSGFAAVGAGEGSGSVGGAGGLQDDRAGAPVVAQGIQGFLRGLEGQYRPGIGRGPIDLPLARVDCGAQAGIPGAGDFGGVGVQAFDGLLFISCQVLRLNIGFFLRDPDDHRQGVFAAVDQEDGVAGGVGRDGSGGIGGHVGIHGGDGDLALGAGPCQAVGQAEGFARLQFGRALVAQIADRVLFGLGDDDRGEAGSAHVQAVVGQDAVRQLDDGAVAGEQAVFLVRGEAEFAGGKLVGRDVVIGCGLLAAAEGLRGVQGLEAALGAEAVDPDGDAAFQGFDQHGAVEGEFHAANVALGGGGRGGKGGHHGDVHIRVGGGHVQLGALGQEHAVLLKDDLPLADQHVPAVGAAGVGDVGVRALVEGLGVPGDPFAGVAVPVIDGGGDALQAVLLRALKDVAGGVDVILRLFGIRIGIELRIGVELRILQHFAQPVVFPVELRHLFVVFVDIRSPGIKNEFVDAQLQKTGDGAEGNACDGFNRLQAVIFIQIILVILPHVVGQIIHPGRISAHLGRRV